jgi:hypothetical protein
MKMVPKFLIPYLQIGHGLFNLGLLAAFVYQGWLGWLIRRDRQGKRTRDVARVRRHRALGPILAGLLPIGYLGGLILSYLNHGVWTRYPLHLVAGSLLIATVTATWLLSKKIRGVHTPWRTTHFVLGLVILILFLCQVFLGLNVLL